MNRRAFALALLLLAGCGAEAEPSIVAAPAVAPATAPPPTSVPPTSAASTLPDRLVTLPSSPTWTPAGDTPLPFATHHPQGIARIGATWYLSAVEVTEAPDPTHARPPLDRSPGAGRGHLIAFADDGTLRARALIGEGTVYHPGGIDTDGEWLWVPVSEYRPRGRSIIYRVDPATLQATEAFRVPDHIGAIIVDRDRLIGLSWGSRTVYAFSRDGRVLDRRANPSGYIDLQDCRGLADGLALCGGVRRHRHPEAPGGSLRVGGLEVIDLQRFTPVWQMPFETYTPGPDPRPMTYNATDCDFGPTEARCAFVPADQPSVLYRINAAY